MKKIVIGIVVVFVLCVVAILFIGRTFYPDNIAKTAEDGGKKGLKTRVYKADSVTVAKAVKELVPTLSTYGGSWKIVDKSDGDEVKAFKIEVPVIIFTDDLEVKIAIKTDGEVKVNVRSASRVGKSDFGENARHIRKFLSALDKKMKAETSL